MPKQVFAPPAFERDSDVASPISARLPKIKGGICDRCGVIDPNQPSEIQYTLCPHYRMFVNGVRCNYCDATKNPREVVRMSVMNVAESPMSRPEAPKFIAWCDSYECAKRHLERFDPTYRA